jgi:hypothetical protein
MFLFSRSLGGHPQSSQDNVQGPGFKEFISTEETVWEETMFFQRSGIPSFSAAVKS